MTQNLNVVEDSIRLARLTRKDALPHGAQRRIARKLGVEEISVSLVMNDKAEGAVKARDIARIRREVARRLKRPVEEVFPAITHEKVA